MPSYFLQSYLFFLRKEKRLLVVGCDKMLFTTLYFHMFQPPLDPLGGFALFFFSFKPPLSHLTLDSISCVLLAQTSGALMVVSQKSSHQKAVSVV